MAAHVQFAILLREAGSPNADAIRRAFRTFTHLTDADAIRLAANAQGILMRHLGVDEAKALQRALFAEGVNSAVVNEDELRFLPASQLLQRIELQHDELIIFDREGRTTPVPWQRISLVAAGAVPHVEIGNVPGSGAGSGWVATLGRWTQPPTESRSRLETKQHLILELIVDRGVGRYEVQAHQFPFQHVLERSGAALTEKFVWLVREMTRRAPQALLNRAAQDIRDGVTLVRGYPSQPAMLDEMLWLLWSRAHGSATK